MNYVAVGHCGTGILSPRMNRASRSRGDRGSALPSVGLASVLVCSLGLTSCESMIVWATTEPATWSYVEEGFGGIALEGATAGSEHVELRFKLYVHEATRIDSAVCLRRTEARVDAGRILVRLILCTGDGRQGDPLSVLLRPLPPGNYDLAYDDAAAGFPKFGELKL